MRISSQEIQTRIKPFTPKSDFIDLTLSNARRFYSSKGDPLGVKGLKQKNLERCWQAHKTNASALLRSNCCFNSFGIR